MLKTPPMLSTNHGLERVINGITCNALVLRHVKRVVRTITAVVDAAFDDLFLPLAATAEALH